MTSTPEDNSGPAAVYRLFDAAEQLLYIGSTSDLDRRWIDHKREKSWWGDVASHTVEWHPSRTEAFVVEGQAIKAEKPLHNILGTPAGAVLAKASRSAWVARQEAIGVFGDYADHPDGAVVAFARAREQYEASKRAAEQPPTE